jgi:hypothetical protein
MHNHAPFVTGVHCMAHHINLVVQTLRGLSLVKKIESLISYMYNYFIHNPKCHLEVIKLAKLLDYKHNKILKNIKTQWILLLSPSKRVLNEYKTMVQNILTINTTKINSELLYMMWRLC